MTNLMHNSFIL